MGRFLLCEFKGKVCSVLVSWFISFLWDIETERSSLLCLTSSYLLHIGFFLLQEKLKEYNQIEWGDTATELTVDKLKLWRGSLAVTSETQSYIYWSYLEAITEFLDQWSRAKPYWLWCRLQLIVKCSVWRHKMAPVSLLKLSFHQQILDVSWKVTSSKTQ